MSEQGKGYQEHQEQQKVLARIEFTEEQRRQIAQVAGRDIKAARIVELTADETRRIAPGVVRAAAIVMCW